MDVDRRLEALEEENERLRDELEYLRASLGMDFVPPLSFRLTPAEGKMLGRFLKGGLVTKEAFMALLYRDVGSDEAEIKIIDVFVCKLRRKLKPLGLEIGTRWGVGYEMGREMIGKYNEEWGDEQTSTQ